MSRNVFVPHNGGMVDYQGESAALFKSMEVTPGGFSAVYCGDSDDSVWADFIDPTPVVTVLNATGSGVLHFDPARPDFLIVKKGEPVTITATNPGPAGTWSTPVQAPYGPAVVEQVMQFKTVMN